MTRVHAKKKTGTLLWVLAGVLLGTTALAEAAENWQTDPYDYYHSQYRSQYRQEERYPENPQGEWRYEGELGYEGYAGYPPRNAPREYGRDPRGYPAPQREYSYYDSYPSGRTPREYARGPRGGYPEPPQRQWQYTPRGAYMERPRAERPRDGAGKIYPMENAPRGYAPPRGYMEQSSGYPRGGYSREPREYPRDPRGGFVPPPEYDRGGYPEPRGGYPEGGYYPRGDGQYQYPRPGYFGTSDRYFQERYEDIVQEYFGGRYPSEPYSPYRY